MFTGGGSLALYAGLAGTAIGLGSAVYDVLDVRGRQQEAEELYGTGLTEETRLSDVPPEWRFLYSAWLNLGINAVMAAFMLKGLGSAAKSALRGEEAAVEAEARALAKRLRARGVAAAEDDIVKATMQALREEGLITGAVRGTSIYRVGSKLQLVGGPGKSLEKVMDAELLATARVHGATLAKDAAAAAAADEVGYALSVPTKAGGTEVVRINVRARATADLAPGPHGAASGPGRLVLSRDASGWKATIELDQGLDPRDLRFVAGHELDEIADIVHRRPRARPGDIARETQSAYFQQAGTTRTPTGRAVPVPGHDLATGEELKALMAELDKLRKVSGTAAGQLVRERQIDALMREMGLFEPAQLADRAALLRRLGLDEALARRVEARALLGELQATVPTSAVGLQARLATTVDEAMVEHLLHAEGQTGGAFLKNGVSGGHVTAELQAFEKANPQYAFDLDKVKQSATGGTYRRWKQYLWKGKGTPPTSKALRPGGSKFNGGDWDLSLSPKTTGDDARALLADADDAWARWLDANPTLSRSGDAFGRGLSGTGPPAISASQVEFSGYFDYTAATSTAPERWRLARTLFVDASWF